MAELVTLTTDFGARDPYVAAMKGVIWRLCPGAHIVDLSHHIAPQDVREGALFVAGAMPYFPPDTIHVVVVDPGVGGARHPLALRAGNQYFVCPDNGLLTLFLRSHPLQEAHVLSNPKFHLEKVSATFHGRDIFAPAAAYLAKGASLSEMGPPAENLVSLALPEPERAGDALRGEVIHVDRFGNLITNVSRAMIGGLPGPSLHVRVAGIVLAGIHRTYGDVAMGQALALFGSSDHMEVAVNGANAARELNAGIGTLVEIGPSE